MRFTIERIRTLVLAAAVLLLVALGLFLVRAKWKNYANRRDLPQRLAKDILEEANGFDYVHAFGAHSQFKIHASKVLQLRDNRMQLHEVRIEIYGGDGSRVDQIAGETFDYDQKSGLAIAEGPVEMVLARPAARPRAASSGAASRANASGEIHLKTSGVTFDQDTGLVATAQRVDFTIKQGFGSAIGAMYDSQNGYLTLDHAVKLTTERGGEPVQIQAQHAEFDRGAQACVLRSANMAYRGGHADAAQAKILFRTDGTAQRLDATGGFQAQTASGGHLAAPTAQMDFDQHNEPQHGLLDGGVTMSSAENGRTMHGTSSTAELEFSDQGELRQTQLRGGVIFTTEQTSPGQATTLSVTRTWRSPIADVDFRDAGKGKLELASIHGTGGVVITTESRGDGEVAAPSRMAANEVTGTFGEGSVLHTLTGAGHATIAQTTATGTRQTANGDRLVAQFVENKEQAGSKNGSLSGSGAVASGTGEVESAEVQGHVVLTEQPAVEAGAQPKPPMRARAGKAVYADTGEWLHLTINPVVDYGGLELTAKKVDVSQQSGDAFAHGDVKGTWVSTGPTGSDGQNAAAGEGAGAMTLGGKGPAHVIADEAQMNESTGEATFRGHARLWQQTNSVWAPVIILNQHLRTLVARSSNPSEPVRTVMLSASEKTAGLGLGSSPGRSEVGNLNGRLASPSVIRVRGGELWYSEAEHRAVMRSGVLGAVIAETGTATSSSDSVDLQLMPGTNQEGAPSGQTQVDRLTAMGHVKLTSQGRHGTGEQLQYSSVTGDYKLTGTASIPPELTDAERGTVTGEALIFNSRDDSVSIEGGGRETITETTAPAR